ncbi:flagellar basal body rod modification protein [Reichenbachiella agarivorans]|uniref:Flagellar basal body rod modification protein n=1 Tax=Reichenbachiella agarivorans TaxID=2979464 RepID=A0ABY6CVM9_9BACT|nr:FlgD immunoglobulin-like domain containing protein [Reichenbachiella agarivorans]UXP32310.1 flagellar basal body rod modification protein [Reichenbachiella agarivorans]
MINHLLKSFVILITSIAWLSACEQPASREISRIADAPSAIGTKENPNKRLEFEIMQLVDPATQRIPELIHQQEVSFARALNQRYAPNARALAQDWESGGPHNVGGRTRAFAMDVDDENVLIAGGVSGGMYRSVDKGNNWTRTSHPSTLNNATCVTQDQRAGFHHVWYYGTGELRGNSSTSGGAPYRGDGIYRSLDGGLSWDVIPSTANGRPADFESPFNYVWSIVVDDQGVIYAALYGCIVKSADDGLTWEVVLGPDLLHPDTLDPPIEDLNDSGAPFYTNLMKTPSGKIYATLSTFTALGHKQDHAGFFVLEPGEVAWEEITPFNFDLNYNRTVMSYAPSNEDILYFLTDGIDLSLKVREGKTWIDRSMNLPGKNDTLPALNSQDSYNLLVKVHPSDENIVFIGGTNLYRSTDGFRSSDHSAWIGGYDPESGTASKYPNHHPDQHEIVFLPSDPNSMFSTNDGGVRFTANNMATLPQWDERNDGFITSQFYTIALSKQEGSFKALGGMQDNGTYLKILGNPTAPWIELLGGDGSYVSTTPDDRFWYASFQEGTTFRLSLNDEHQLVSFAEVDPVGGEGYLFVNPFVLDPNNYNRMYMAGGDVIWRNDNLSQIPAGIQQPTSVNWSEVNSTKQFTLAISTLAVSTYPANVLYFGMTSGSVHKTIYANTDSAQTTQLFKQTITNDEGQSVSGYVSNVAIDPTNADRVIFSYSNYHFPSLFYTADGGETVVDISGNLEENPDGSGGGPSVRWSQIVPMADGSFIYFISTSVGLYSATELNGAETIWTKEADETIGNSLIRMTDYRPSDGKLIVATHGNGVFVTHIEGQLQKMPQETAVEKFQLVNAYPNPFADEVRIELEIPVEGRVVVEILSPSGQLIRTLLNNEQFDGTVSVVWDGRNAGGVPLDDGLYLYRVYYAGKFKSGKIIYLKN